MGNEIKNVINQTTIPPINCVVWLLFGLDPPMFIWIIHILLKNKERSTILVIYVTIISVTVRVALIGML